MKSGEADSRCFAELRRSKSLQPKGPVHDPCAPDSIEAEYVLQEDALHPRVCVAVPPGPGGVSRP